MLETHMTSSTDCLNKVKFHGFKAADVLDNPGGQEEEQSEQQHGPNFRFTLKRSIQILEIDWQNNHQVRSWQ